jgi:hypothetical protein
VFAGWFLACAGDDIPPIEDDLRGTIAAEFGGASMVASSAGSAGSGTGGRGGSGSSGSGNSGSANAGSGNSGGGAAGDGGEPVGGGGGSDLPAPGCDGFSIIAMSCALGGSGCHGTGSGQGAFAVDEDGVLEFVDKPSTKGNACNQVFIDSTNPEDSLIYTRLFAADCGGTLQMPAAGDLLTEEQSDCVLSWLQQFAE